MGGDDLIFAPALVLDEFCQKLLTSKLEDKVVGNLPWGEYQVAFDACIGVGPNEGLRQGNARSKIGLGLT